MQKSKNNTSILSLFFTMLKIGLFTFGGGYGMIALLENELVQKKGWITKDEFLDMVAIAESTPGPIAINSATYIGYKVAKFWGAFFATLAVCIPSFVIIFCISLFLNAFLSIKVVSYAFSGVQVCVTFLILTAGIKMIKDVKKDVISIVITCTIFLAVILLSMFAVNFSSIFYILISGVIGLFVYLIRRVKAKKSNELPIQDENTENENLADPQSNALNNEVIEEVKVNEEKTPKEDNKKSPATPQKTDTKEEDKL